MYKYVQYVQTDNTKYSRNWKPILPVIFVGNTPVSRSSGLELFVADIVAPRW